MTYTVTLLADHKGNTSPKVMGDQYVVDALVDITSYASTAIAPVVTFVHGTNTMTRTSGDAITGLEVGQQVAFTNCVDGGNNITTTIATRVNDDEVTLAALAASEVGDTITITNINEVLSASDFGLTNFHTLVVTGKEDKTYDFFPRVESDGTYLTSSKLELKAVTAASSAEVATTTNVGSIRVRIWGQL